MKKLFALMLALTMLHGSAALAATPTDLDVEPSPVVSEEPTQAPSPEPTQAPVEVPVETPTEAPAATPTVVPTQAPTEEPTPRAGSDGSACTGIHSRCPYGYSSGNGGAGGGAQRGNSPDHGQYRICR